MVLLNITWGFVTVVCALHWCAARVNPIFNEQVAVSPNSSEVHILEQKGGSWTVVHVLAEHDLPVTAIDWAQNTNRIVTCSQDKNAFVWTFVDGAWKPELVLVRLPRAATCVRWSPKENKFAVGSGARIVSVCYYEKENDWWLSKQIKKPLRSTVTCLDWHPANILLAVGCSDYKTRVYAAYVKDVDSPATPTPWGGLRTKWADLVAEYSSHGGGWVHSVRFSPSGCRLAWVGHDCSLCVVDANQGIEQHNVMIIKDWWLPFTCLLWVSENSIVAAGHDCCPMLFTYDGQTLSHAAKLDVPAEEKANKITAMNKFRKLEKVATVEDNSALKTLHQNRITGVAAVNTSPTAGVQKFSTVGIDGLLAVWDLKGVGLQIH